MTNQGECKAVVFDVGRVLINWDLSALFAEFFDSPNDMERFLAETELLAWNLRFDAGEAFAPAIAELCKQFPHYASALQAFDSRWSETVPSAIEGSVQILHRLKQAGTPLYAITNFSAEKWPLAQARYDFLATSFQDVVVSGEERLLKPDPEIYQTLLRRNDLEAGSCIFIDDSPKNVEGANAVGMDGILFVDPQQLEAELVERGFLKTRQLT